MKKTKKILLEDYDRVNSMINNMSITDEGYDDLLKERDNIRNELIKFNTDFCKIIVTVGEIVITSVAGIWTVKRSFRFDETSTITSTVGRNSINNFVSKMFRRQ